MTGDITKMYDLFQNLIATALLIKGLWQQLGLFNLLQRNFFYRGYDEGERYDSYCRQSSCYTRYHFRKHIISSIKLK